MSKPALQTVIYNVIVEKKINEKTKIVKYNFI